MTKISKPLHSVPVLCGILCLCFLQTDAKGRMWYVYDAGDSYRYSDEQIPIWRVAGAAVVFFEDDANQQETLDLLTGEGGALQGYTGTLQNGQVILSADPYLKDDVSSLQTEEAIAALVDVEGVEWGVHLFVNSESYLLQYTADEIIVKLEEGVAIEDIVNPDVLDYRHLSGSANSFALTLGLAGVDLLAAIPDWRDLPGIVRASPNFYNQIVVWPNTPDSFEFIPNVPEPGTLLLLFVGMPLLAKHKQAAPSR